MSGMANTLSSGIVTTTTRNNPIQIDLPAAAACERRVPLRCSSYVWSGRSHEMYNEMDVVGGLVDVA